MRNTNSINHLPSRPSAPCPSMVVVLGAGCTSMTVRSAGSGTGSGCTTTAGVVGNEVGTSRPYGAILTGGRDVWCQPVGS
jgi:hypothetical protein